MIGAEGASRELHRHLGGALRPPRANAKDERRASVTATTLELGPRLSRPLGKQSADQIAGDILLRFRRTSDAHSRSLAAGHGAALKPLGEHAGPVRMATLAVEDVHTPEVTPKAYL